MTYKVTYNADEDCVHARIEGRVDLTTARRYAKEIIKRLSAHHCLRLLNDMRNASISLSTVDIYDLPAWIEEACEAAGVNWSFKRALLVSRDFNDYEFYETVSRNHGHVLEVFADSEKTGILRDMAMAREWLGLTTAEPAQSAKEHPGVTRAMSDRQH